MAEPIDRSQVRVRQCELNEDQLDSMDPSALPKTDEDIKFDPTHRNLNSRLPISDDAKQLLTKYTLAITVDQFVTLEDFQTEYMGTDNDTNYESYEALQF